jgi:hypothetical protein
LTQDDEFALGVTFKGKDLEFPARVLAYGYSFKLEVDIEGTKVQFEPDEERNWRALISYEDAMNNKKLNPDLLETIARVIEEILK